MRRVPLGCALGIDEMATLGGPHERRKQHPKSGCSRHHRAHTRLLGDPVSWEKWVERYESCGYRVLAPAYPGLEVEVEALREDPSPIEELTVPAIFEHYERIVGELESRPIIMGHSVGGLFTQ